MFSATYEEAEDKLNYFQVHSDNDSAKIEHFKTSQRKRRGPKTCNQLTKTAKVITAPTLQLYGKKLSLIVATS